MGIARKKLVRQVKEAEHSSQYAVGRTSGDPAMIVTKLNERRQQQADASSSLLAGSRKRYSLASTAPHANRLTLGGQ